jgi:cytochrome c oxidase subunit III
MFCFIVTPLYALHLTTGIALVLFTSLAGAAFLSQVRRGRLTPSYAPLEVGGLYWSFVDTV